MAQMTFEIRLKDALGEFQCKLTQPERARLQNLRAVPEASDVMVFTAQLDAENAKRKTRSVASRLIKLLESIQQFSGVISTSVSSNPALAALLWGSVQLMLLLANNSFAYFDKLSSFLNKIGRCCPRYSDYSSLFLDDERLQGKLCDFYAEIVKCCTHVCEIIHRPGWVNLVRNAWITFDSDFGEFRDRLEEMRYEVEGEIRLASDRASSKERGFQSEHRRNIVLFTKRNDNALAKAQKQNLRQLAQEKLTERDHLLAKSSEYDQNTAYSQASSKCCAGTGQWILTDPDLQHWQAAAGSRTLWITVGCGKSILMSQVVQHLYRTCPTRDVRKVYFFCRFNDRLSVLADTILRSLLRQCLDASSLPKDIENELESLLRQVWVDSRALCDILKSAITRYRTVYMIIDGIDECDASQRSVVLRSLSSLVTSHAGILKLIIASRMMIARPLIASSTHILDVNIRRKQFQEDVGTFIDKTLELRIDDDDLCVGDPHVIIEVREALLSGAKGMFLWVALQMDDICRQISDEKIKCTLRHLPKDLRETYARMLSRIQLDEKASLALQAFKWVAMSQRPLTLPELAEALAIEPFAKFSRPESMVKYPPRIISWCEGLLMLHDDGEVQFAHPTVREVLTGDCESSRIGTFSFSPLEANKEVGELCVTYLGFNDFKTQLIKAAKSRHLPARTVVESSMPENINKGLAKVLLKISRIGSRSHLNSPDVLRPLAQVRPNESGNSSITTAVRHPFLAYASRHWLAHSSSFHQNDRIWSMWHGMITKNESLAIKPWTCYDWTHNRRTISSYIVRMDHVALFHVVFHIDNTADHEEIAWILENAARTGHVTPIRAILELGYNRHPTLNRGLHAAAEGGHLEVVTSLLAAKANVNAGAAGTPGRTVLQAAAEGGHFEVVEILLAARADVNAAAAHYSGRTALQAAAEGGFLDIVETLLAADANVNASAASDSGRTALQAAAGGGHLDVVETLLIAKADVNADAAFSFGRTALQAAIEGGHLDVIEVLEMHDAE